MQGEWTLPPRQWLLNLLWEIFDTSPRTGDSGSSETQRVVTVSHMENSRGRYLKPGIFGLFEDLKTRRI